MVVIQTFLVHKFDTSVSHMLKGLFQTVIYDWLPIICGAGNAHSFPGHLISLPLGFVCLD